MCKLLTVREVSIIMKCSEDLVVKRFADMPGAVDLGRAETRYRRLYRILRIPKHAFEAFLGGKGRSLDRR
jgi:hypothetical protein